MRERRPSIIPLLVSCTTPFMDLLSVMSCKSSYPLFFVPWTSACPHVLEPEIRNRQIREVHNSRSKGVGTTHILNSISRILSGRHLEFLPEPRHKHVLYQVRSVVLMAPLIHYRRRLVSLGQQIQHLLAHLYYHLRVTCFHFPDKLIFRQTIIRI